jgi:hypothetical protein
MPSTVGSCVEMMVMLAEVTKAEMGTYGMNSISQPSRMIPRASNTAPARKDSAWAMASGLYTPGCSASTLLMTLPTSSDPTAVVLTNVSNFQARPENINQKHTPMTMSFDVPNIQ